VSNFDFLKPQWPDAHEAAVAAEASALGDPRVPCFQARRAVELETEIQVGLKELEEMLG